MKITQVLGLCVGLAGCSIGVPTDSTTSTSGPDRSGTDAARSFIRVVERMEPVAERICRAKTAGVNCDFQIVVDDRKGQPANAYQTVDKSGRPIIAFTLALIARAQNDDELAFVMGHEAAHHISGHLTRTHGTAVAGAVIGGLLATLVGADAAVIGNAQDLGAKVGSRAFSKGFELEADSLGTVIAFRAGFDPERGAAFFTRIPDPGDQFLGTHPPNSSRIKTVRDTLQTLR